MSAGRFCQISFEAYQLGYVVEKGERHERPIMTYTVHKAAIKEKQLEYEKQ